MRAWVLKGIGDISYLDVVKPAPARGEVLVRVMAAGICGSDVPRVYRDGAHRMPLIPGHEFAGEVVGLGDGADAKWLRRRVGVYPLIPCRSCPSCQSGRYEMCASYDYLGSRRDGGFAEYAAVPAQNLIALPDSVSYEQAAMLEPFAVAAHAVRRVLPLKGMGAAAGGADAAGDVLREQGMGVAAGGTDAAGRASREQRMGAAVSDASAPPCIVVCGMGTIGMLILMLLLSAGYANVLAIGNKDFQREMARSLGLPRERFCDVRRQPASGFVMAQTGGIGADVFFECVGKSETISQAVALSAPGGRVCLVGNPASDVTLGKQDYWQILRHQLYVTGTWNSAFFAAEDVSLAGWQLAHDRPADRCDAKDAEGAPLMDWQLALSAIAEGCARPEFLITHRLPLSSLGEGLRIMRDKTEDYGKIMAVME